MAQRTTDNALANPGVMLLSAAIFGFFGFTTSWNYYSVINGQFLFFVALLDWTMKGAAIGFAVSAVLTFIAPLAGNFMYSSISLLSAVSFVVVGILDILDTQHYAMHPFFLFLFAAWNGYGAWVGLQEARSYLANASQDSIAVAPPNPPARLDI